MLPPGTAWPFFLDEPSSAVDPVAQRSLGDAVSWTCESDKAVVITCHRRGPYLDPRMGKRGVTLTTMATCSGLRTQVHDDLTKACDCPRRSYSLRFLPEEIPAALGEISGHHPEGKVEGDFADGHCIAGICHLASIFILTAREYVCSPDLTCVLNPSHTKTSPIL